MAKKPYPSEEQDRFIVRLPDGMRDRIKAMADASGRSMNAEIIHRLQESVALDGMDDGSPIPPGLVSKCMHILYKDAHAQGLEADIKWVKPGGSELSPIETKFVELSKQMQEIVNNPPKHRLYLLLDSAGYPQSWREINEYISALSASAGPFSEINTTVISPSLEDDGGKFEKVKKLAAKLRLEGKSQAIKPSPASQSAPESPPPATHSSAAQSSPAADSGQP